MTVAEFSKLREEEKKKALQELEKGANKRKAQEDLLSNVDPLHLNHRVDVDVLGLYE
jgi:hypothetical protein